MLTLQLIAIEKILQYYAIMCLAFMPVNAILMFVLSKRTSLFDKIDKLIDRVIPPQKKEEDSKKEKETQQEADGKNQELPQQPSEEEIRRMSGISSFEILVGEVYRCHLNFQNRGGSYGGMEWFNDNEFVGKISKEGLFEAKKVGTSNIFCVSKGNMYGSETQAYCIDVVSRYGNWFADALIKNVSDKTPRADIIAKNIRRRILRENPNKRLIEYAGNQSEHVYSLTYQFAENGMLSRAYYRLQSTPQILEEITVMLEERFEEIKLKVSDGYRIWIHQIIDNQHEEVDIYAILKQIHENELVLAFGQGWRDYGEKDEFTDNINMAIRLFDSVFDTQNLKLEAKKEKKTEPANKTYRKKEQKQEENTHETDHIETNDTETSETNEDSNTNEPVRDTQPEDISDEEIEATLDEFENFTEDNDNEP